MDIESIHVTHDHILANLLSRIFNFPLYNFRHLNRMLNVERLAKYLSESCEQRKYIIISSKGFLKIKTLYFN